MSQCARTGPSHPKLTEAQRVSAEPTNERKHLHDNSPPLNPLSPPSPKPDHLAPVKALSTNVKLLIGGAIAAVVLVIILIVAGSHSESYDLGHDTGASLADAPNSSRQSERTINMLCRPFANVFSETGTAEVEDVDYSEFMEGCVDGYHSAER